MVLELGLDPAYVLDRMALYEVELFMQQGWRRNRGTWEQTRTLAYVSAQGNSRKKLKPTDVIKFPWDTLGTTQKKEHSHRISNEDIARLKAAAKRIEDGK